MASTSGHVFASVCSSPGRRQRVSSELYELSEHYKLGAYGKEDILYATKL